MTTEQSSIDQAAMAAISGIQGAKVRAAAYTYFIAGANAGIQAEQERQTASAHADLERQNAAGARKTSGLIIDPSADTADNPGAMTPVD